MIISGVKFGLEKKRPYSARQVFITKEQYSRLVENDGL